MSRYAAYILIMIATLFPFFAPSPKQRVVGGVHSITREIDIADHDTPLPGIRQPFAG